MAREAGFWHPRYWGIWTLLWILRVLVTLPLPWLRRLGEGLGAVFGRLARRRRRIAEKNLELCFPEQTPEQRRDLLHAYFRSAGAGLMEAAFSWYAPESRLRDGYHLEGREHLLAALDEGKGVLLLSAHFMNLELVGRFLLLEHPIALMYRPNENPLVEAQFQRHRGGGAVRAIRRDDVRGALRVLRDQHALWYAPDQRMGGKNSVVVPFFGIPAQTSSATHRIARRSGARVVPFFGYREASGHYRLVIQPALDHFPTENLLADTQRINEVIESLVRQAPEQYLWAHRRFRGRPGLADPYDSSIR